MDIMDMIDAKRRGIRKSSFEEFLHSKGYADESDIGSEDMSRLWDEYGVHHVAERREESLKELNEMISEDTLNFTEMYAYNISLYAINAIRDGKVGQWKNNLKAGDYLQDDGGWDISRYYDDREKSLKEYARNVSDQFDVYNPANWELRLAQSEWIYLGSYACNLGRGIPSITFGALFNPDKGNFDLIYEAGEQKFSTLKSAIDYLKSHEDDYY